MRRGLGALGGGFNGSGRILNQLGLKSSLATTPPGNTNALGMNLLRLLLFKNDGNINWDQRAHLQHKKPIIKMDCIWRWLPERILKNEKPAYCLESLHTAHCQESPCCQDQSGRLPPGADIHLSHLAPLNTLVGDPSYLQCIIRLFLKWPVSGCERACCAQVYTADFCTSVRRGPCAVQGDAVRLYIRDLDPYEYIIALHIDSGRCPGVPLSLKVVPKKW